MRGGRTLAFESGSENARLQLANCIEKFDPYLEVWHQLNTTGTPHPGLDGAACSSIAELMYMYGGDNWTGCCGEGVLSCLNTKTLTWSQFCPEATDCGPMRKQGCGMMIYRDENIVVIGGVGIPTCPIQPGEVSSDVLIVEDGPMKSIFLTSTKVFS